MMKRLALSALLITFIAVNIYAQTATKYINRDKEEVKYTEEELALKLPPNFKPLFNYPMRDIAICRGPDSTYYMTGTTGGPDWWAVTSEIKVWKSKDLKTWKPVVDGSRERATVWNVDQEGTPWQQKIVKREGVPFRPLWAPEIHYINGNFWLTYCFPQLGYNILKSSTGKPEGPYIAALAIDAPFGREIDASLFQDDDGKVYSVAGSGKITLMKDDLSAAAEPGKYIKPANMKSVGFEGAFLFKANGKYHMAAADFVNGSYHCFIASADNIYGPYGDRYLAIPHGGHTTFFKDNEGDLWATFFGNDKYAPFKERPAILRMEIDEHGHIRPHLK